MATYAIATAQAGHMGYYEGSDEAAAYAAMCLDAGYATVAAADAASGSTIEDVEICEVTLSADLDNPVALYADGRVRYWSVLAQVWVLARVASIPDEERVAMSAEDRRLLWPSREYRRGAEARRATVRMRCTYEEKAEWTEAAQRADLSISDWIRKTLVKRRDRSEARLRDINLLMAILEEATADLQDIGSAEALAIADRLAAAAQL